MIEDIFKKLVGFLMPLMIVLIHLMLRRI